MAMGAHDKVIGPPLLCGRRATEVGEPWQQAQDAQELGRRHGLALIPADLREGFSMNRWPGSPQCRLIYRSAAEKVIRHAAHHFAKAEVADVADRIGGIFADTVTGDLTPRSKELLTWEIRCSQAGYLHAIDEGPDPATTRYH